jgi:osmotically-inducible protein OsmY
VNAVDRKEQDMAVATRSAEEIKKDVVDQLFWDGRIDAADVQVEVSADRVTLSGTVPTLGARHAADEDAWLIEGVKAVNNQLNVRFPAGVAPPNDETISSNAVNTLLWHPDIDSSDITPVVNEGRLTLKGSVGSYWQKMLAEEITSTLSGVLDVTNELAVVPSKDVTDQSIARALVSGLERNAYVDPETIHIKVQDGVVTLAGEVPNLLAYRSAHDVARYTVGVVNVVNSLTLRTEWPSAQ